MTHTYKVTGMTCKSCQASVKDVLLAIEQVDDVIVNLEAGEVDITMKKHIDLEIFRNALPSKYNISEKIVATEQNQISSHTIDEIEEKSKLQQLKPLLIILGYIAIASNLIHFKDWQFTEVMLDFMGLFFIVFSFFKMLDLKGFPDSFRMYDPLAKKIPVYAQIYPFLETALGIMLLMRFEVKIALMATLVILGITTYGVTKTLLDKKSITCACLGTALKLPMTEATFIENAIMIVMAVIMLF